MASCVFYLTSHVYGYILITDSQNKGWAINYKEFKKINMPGFDGTGPSGSGPATGRGMGPCGAGMGWGRGRRRLYQGWGRCPYWPISQEQEREALDEEARILERDLKSIKDRLKELKKKK